MKININGMTLEGEPKELAKIVLLVNKQTIKANQTKAPNVISRKEVAEAIHRAHNAREAITNILTKTQSIHTVYSGLNDGIRRRFNVNPIEVVNKMVDDGILTIRPAKGGMVITLIK